MALEEKLKLSTLLPARRIFLFGDLADKQEVLDRLLRVLCPEGGPLDRREVARQLAEREKGISTTLDTGLALPHVRLEELEQFEAALAVLPQGLPDPAAHQQIKVLFLLLSPARPAFFQKHLQILGLLAQTFTPDLMARLDACSTAAQAAQILADTEKDPTL